MTPLLNERLNKVLDRLLDEDLLNGRGLGNEIGFYIFDYPAENELEVRERIQSIVKDTRKKRPDLRVCHVDVFEMVISHLADRGLLEKAMEMQRVKGDAALLSALSAPLQADKLAKVFQDIVKPDEQDLVILSGIGSAYPLVRSHSLLNNLQAVMKEKPLVLFFPGSYTGQSLSLFGRLRDDNYYRAFRLVP